MTLRRLDWDDNDLVAAVEVLERAKARMLRCGKGPSFGVNPDGTVCIGAAVWYEGHEVYGFMPGQSARNFLPINNLSEFNDAPERTLADCVAELDAAMLRARDSMTDLRSRVCEIDDSELQHPPSEDGV